MRHYIEQNNAMARYKGRFAADNDGTRHPLKALTRAEKAALGVYEAERVEAEPPSQWHRQTDVEREIDGDVVKETPVFEPMSHEQIKNHLRSAVEDHVEDTAQSRDYSSAVSLASYTASTREPWAAEAQAFVQWRDDVWEYVFARLAAVESGEDDPPESAEALIADLPEMVWPE